MAHLIARAVRRALDAVLDFVYPPLCLVCGELLESGREQVCKRCWGTITPAVSAARLYNETKSKLLVTGVVDDLVSLYVFQKDSAFQQIIHALKYSGIESLGVELGRRIGERLREEAIHADIVVPVPLHKRRLRERGYNQASLIARGISEMTGIPVGKDLVIRRRWTQTQTQLNLEERQKNVADAFVCLEHDLQGKTIVVIDDVITTGSTIVACGAVLKNAGAAKIIAVSAALAE